MNGKLKVYESFGSIIVEYPNKKTKLFPPEGYLSSSLDSGNITITADGVEGVVAYSIPFSDIRDKSGSIIAPTAAGTNTILNSLFENSNPSDIASKAVLDEVSSRVRKTSDADGNVLVVDVDSSSDAGKLKVRSESALLGLGQNEAVVDLSGIRFSVKSNTGNIGSEVKSDAIVITGEESSSSSIVDMKGTMKLSTSAESKFVMDNTSTTNGKTTFSGNSSYINLPEGSSYSSNLTLGKNVIIGNADDPIGRGARNYFEVSGLSTGDTVLVEARIVVLCDSSHTVVLDDSRTNQSSSVTTSETGLTNVDVSMTNVVDNYGDIRYHFNLNTSGSGNYRVSKITVTIS